MKEYDKGWNAALVAAIGVLEREADACVGDIVPGDVAGRKESNARAVALLAAISDLRALQRCR